MKKPKPLLLGCLLLLQFSGTAQVQWYQNQDGQNLPPAGTFAASVKSISSSAFIACYLWQSDNADYTWKISKTNLDGSETRHLFLSGPGAQVEMKLTKNRLVYVLKREFPFGQDAVFTLYKLNANLEILGQRNISFPGSFSIINLNAFELDEDGNIFLAGDGQYPDGPGYSPASFVMKADKYLQLKWSRMDSTQTSYTRLHADRWGRVTVIADYYAFYPDVKIIRISANGQNAVTYTVNPDAGRNSLHSLLDNDNNLLLYGEKSVNDTTAAFYGCRVSLYSGRVIYHKTHFMAPGLTLNDLVTDNQGRLFSLVTQYYNDRGPQCKIARISPANGRLLWSRNFSYEQDSCQLTRLVVDADEQFYALGEKYKGDFFRSGFVLRLKKSGQSGGQISAPDSAAFQRSHQLTDGIIDGNGQLIAIGNTNDLDTATYSSTYYRAFAARFMRGGGHPPMSNEAVVEAEDSPGDKPVTADKWVVYPNPAQNQLLIRNSVAGEYDRVTVFNMQGTAVLQQILKAGTERLDVSSLDDGVYLLVLRNSVSGKEKSVKIIVRK